MPLDDFIALKYCIEPQDGAFLQDGSMLDERQVPERKFLSSTRYELTILSRVPNMQKLKKCILYGSFRVFSGGAEWPLFKPPTDGKGSKPGPQLLRQ